MMLNEVIIEANSRATHGMQIQIIILFGYLSRGTHPDKKKIVHIYIYKYIMALADLVDESRYERARHIQGRH